MINLKTSLFFAVRKYLNLSQEEMAQLFGFSQSKIARIENGKTPIWDHEWNAFLSKINLSQENNPSFFLHGTSTLDLLYKKVHLIEKESFTPSVKMRTTSTPFSFIRSELGKEKILDEILNEYTLFKNFHQILDFKIHPIYFEQFTERLFKENLLSFETLDEVSKFHTQISSMTPQCQSIIKQQISPRERVKQVCSRSHDYADYEYYSFKESYEQLIVRKHYRIPRTFQMTDICNYETSYLEQIANHSSTHKYFSCKKTKCYFLGHDFCEYHLQD